MPPRLHPTFLESLKQRAKKSDFSSNFGGVNTFLKANVVILVLQVLYLISTTSRFEVALPFFNVEENVGEVEDVAEWKHMTVYRQLLKEGPRGLLETTKKKGISGEQKLTMREMEALDRANGVSLQSLEERKLKIKVLISVQSSKKLLGKLGVMQRATWGQLLRSNIDIVFVVGDPTLEKPVPIANQTVLLPCSDDYPPLNKQFQMLKYWYDYRLEEFDFFVKIDGDSYVNINLLLDLLKFLEAPRSTHYYFGEPGEGNSEDIGHLGLNGTYCTGIAFIFSHYSIKMLGPHLDECLDDVVSIWDDAEVGRCMQKHLDLQCTLERNGHPYNLRKMFYNVYFWDEDLQLFDLKKESTGQMKGKIPKQPKQIHFDSIVLHPFKNPDDLRRFHDQVTKYLRPIQFGLYLDKKFKNRLPKQLQQYVKPKSGIQYRDSFYSYFWELHASCVHSPALQYVLTGFWLPECPLSQQISKLMRIDGEKIPKYVLSMDSPKAKKEFEKKKAMLARFNYDLKRLIAVDGSKLANATKKQIDPETGELMEAGDKGYTLTPGEVGYRESMRKLFNEWYKTRENNLIMVFDDDFVVHKDFRNKLDILLHNTRCAGHLFTKNEGGILLLGGFEFINGSYPHITKWTGGWHLIDEEFRIRAHNRRMQLLSFPPFQFTTPDILSKNQPHQTCYNIHDRTFGSFAVIYSANIIPPIMKWMDDPAYNHKPFDHVFQYLSKLGYIVRVAYPNIVVSDITHESSVDNTRLNEQDLQERANVFRWNLDDFLI